jgi:hypothetical protein
MVWLPSCCRRSGDALARNSAIRSVSIDARVEVSATDASSAATSTVADRFDAVNYTNDDGNHRWASAWTEIGDDGAPLTGKIGISLNLLSSLTGGGRLTLSGTGAGIARKAAIAPGAQHATLRFDVQRVSLESNDFVSVQASKDGVRWTEVGRVKGPANDSQLSKVGVRHQPVHQLRDVGSPRCGHEHQPARS